MLHQELGEARDVLRVSRVHEVELVRETSGAMKGPSPPRSRVPRELLVGSPPHGSEPFRICPLRGSRGRAAPVDTLRRGCVRERLVARRQVEQLCAVQADAFGALRVGHDVLHRSHIVECNAMSFFRWPCDTSNGYSQTCRARRPRRVSAPRSPSGV
jgi:hypothetical protein